MSIDAPQSIGRIERTLRSSRKKWLQMVGIGTVLGSGGVLMILDGEPLGWLVTIFFGACAALGLFTAVRPNRLELGSSGMRSLSLGRTWTFLWQDCGEFSTWEAFRNELVVFDHSGPSASRRLSRLNKQMSGGNASLPETYGLRAAELASLLNEFRERATHSPPRTAADG